MAMSDELEEWMINEGTLNTRGSEDETMMGGLGMTLIKTPDVSNGLEHADDTERDMMDDHDGVRGESWNDEHEDDDQERRAHEPQTSLRTSDADQERDERRDRVRLNDEPFALSGTRSPDRMRFEGDGGGAATGNSMNVDEEPGSQGRVLGRDGELGYSSGLGVGGNRVPCLGVATWQGSTSTLTLPSRSGQIPDLRTIDPRDLTMSWKYDSFSRTSVTPPAVSKELRQISLGEFSHRPRPDASTSNDISLANDPPRMPDAGLGGSAGSTLSAGSISTSDQRTTEIAFMTSADCVPPVDIRSAIPMSTSNLTADASIIVIAGHPPQTFLLPAMSADTTTNATINTTPPDHLPLAAGYPDRGYPELEASSPNSPYDSTTFPGGNSRQPTRSPPISRDPPGTIRLDPTSLTHLGSALDATYPSQSSPNLRTSFSPPLVSIDPDLAYSTHSNSPAKPEPVDSSSASSRIAVKHRKLVQIFPDDYQAQMKKRGIKWFGINALAAYLSIHASLVRTGFGSNDGKEDGYQGREGQHEANDDTASRSISNTTPFDLMAESGKAQKPDRPHERKVRALDKVCEWVEREVLRTHEDEGDNETGNQGVHSMQETERALQTLQSTTATSGMTTRNSKTMRSGGKVVKKGFQAIPKQPFQQRLVDAAADLAWKVKQRGVRERSEEGNAGVNRPGSIPSQPGPSTAIDSAVVSGSNLPPSAHVTDRASSSRKPSPTPYPTYISVPTGSSKGTPTWPPDERDRVELAVCTILPETEEQGRMWLARDGCVRIEAEDAGGRDDAVSTKNSTFGQESRAFEIRWMISVRTFVNPLDRFSASMDTSLSLPSFTPCFPTRTYAERFLADVLQHVARTSRPDGLSSHSIFRQLNCADFATIYRGNPFTRMPVLVWIKEIQPPDQPLPYAQLAEMKGVACVVERLDTLGAWKEIGNSRKLDDGAQEIWNSAWRLTGRRIVGLRLGDVEVAMRGAAHTRSAIGSHREVARQFGGADHPEVSSSSTTMSSVSPHNDGPLASLWSAGTFHYHRPTLVGKVWTLVSGWALIGILNLPPPGQSEAKAMWELGLVGADTTLTLPFDTTAFFMFLSDSIALETEWSNPVYAKPLYKIVEDDTVLRSDLLGPITKMVKESQRTTTTIVNLKTLEEILQHAHRLARSEERRKYRILLDQHRFWMAKVQNME